MGASAVKHITVALDGSPASEAARLYARELERAGATLAFCEADPHASLHLAEALVACAQEHASEAIVIGSDAHKGFIHVHESVGESLMRIADRPVIFVHEADRHRDGNIAVTISGYDATHLVLDAAIGIAMALDRELCLISDVIVPIGVDYYAPSSNSDVHLHEAAARASAAGVKSGAAVGDGVGSISTSLIELATQHNCSMIVTGLHDRPGVARLFNGSVAHQIVHDARVPVAVVHYAPQLA